MAVHLVTYDLVSPGKDYQPVYDYLKQFAYCHGPESVWLIDTNKSTEAVRDDLKNKVDSNDVIFVVRLHQDWGSFNYGCANWLNSPNRNW